MEPCLFYSVQGLPADGLHAQQVLPDKADLEKKPACCLEESSLEPPCQDSLVFPVTEIPV